MASPLYAPIVSAHFLSLLPFPTRATATVEATFNPKRQMVTQRRIFSTLLVN